MKKGECYEGLVTAVRFPAKGIVSVEGETIPAQVKHVVPGQKISFRVSKKRKGKVEGTLLAVLEKAPEEIEPVCPHFGSCGGCQYLQLSYEDQLKLKAEQVKGLLDEVYIKLKTEPDYEFQGIKESPNQLAYRNKMEFSFGDEYKDGPLSLGLHKKGSFYDIIPVLDCQIVDEDYRLILKTVLDYFTQEKTDFYHRMRQEGYLRHLLVRKGTKSGELLIALVTSSRYSTKAPEDDKLSQEERKTKEKQVLEGFKQALLDLEKQDDFAGHIAGILHTTNDSVADVVKADQNEILYGSDFFYEELMGLRFQISQFSFFQTNSLGAEVLYETAREYIGKLSDGEPDKIVFDLYSGTGTIAQMLAPVAKKVIGVEIVEEAVEAAKENAKANGLHNCEFIAGDVLKVLDTVEEKPDFIVLDPPRDGIHPKALTKLIAYGVPRIVYISCKPTSLARDMEVFFASGYKMEKACAVDMFPGTGNVECIACLQKMT
ncbi:MAG: 23S rRNA (uracil(1939)-C(5))-methyltransferase RlmD [Lachnospiraceae bacterium]|nr:23S rRNA (uracil(1939)-C(5))-methyltransferase RlmD [Lachnospiraceae bacterium]